MAIAALTCRRPEMFAALLESLLRLRIPDDIRIDFIFVENDDALNIEPACQAFAERTARPVHALHEPVRGIARARNRALHKALELGCDFLAFIDDDEVADEGWIVELLAAQGEFDADLVCGLVRDRIAEPGPQGLFGRWLSAERLRDSQLRERRRLGRKNIRRRGEHGLITVRPRGSTGNWLCRLEFLRRHDLRFDESVGLGRGEDHDLMVRLLKAGAVLVQAPRSLAYQMIPASRLSVRYRYRLKRESVQLRYQKRVRASLGVLLALPVIAFKLLHAGTYLLLAPVTLGRTFASGIDAAGFVAGLARALLGRPAIGSHYGDIHGY